MAPPTEEKIAAFSADVKKRIAGTLYTDRFTRILYSTDASIYQVMPLAVVIPRTIEDVHAVVEMAIQYGVPLLPRTSGSSLAGQAINEAVVIDFSKHLDAILEVNPDERWVRVQPGVVLDELNHYLRPYGLQFGPDPASSNRAAMGGIVSNNSTGAHSILYGMTVEHVLGARAILSDGQQVDFGPVDAATLEFKQKLSGREGEVYRGVHRLVTEHAETIRKGTPHHWRRCGGYNLDRFVEGVTARYSKGPEFNLAKLLSGAEGTLGILTEIRLNLVPRPQQTALALLQFDELHRALAAVPIILEAEPSAVELLDHMGLTLCQQVPEYARLLKTFMVGEPNCVLITEFYGTSERELKNKIDRLKQHLQKKNVRCTVVPAIDGQLQQNVWTVRKVGLGLLMSIRSDYKPIPFIEDSAVPVEHLAEYVQKIEAYCHSLGTDVAYYAHASAGCLHIRPLMNTKKAEEVAKLPLIGARAAELVMGYQGALSSEHGDGRARSWLNEYFFGKELYAVYRQLKQIFDPQNVFNPGMIVDGQYITENLRYGPHYRTMDWKPVLDFTTDGGFDRAVEMCNGAGVCRKKTTGTMCPSFMVTREEEHATRGRANLLRAALSGRLPREDLFSPRMYAALDLCVECKACKAECPSSVDMAKIKTEYLAHYFQHHRIPLRNRIFAAMPDLIRQATRILPRSVVNALMEFPPARWVQRHLGIAPQRRLPRLAPRAFAAIVPEFKEKLPASNRPSKGNVAVFVDCFTNQYHPEVAEAAFTVLAALGFKPRQANAGCCGRTYISKGLVDKAQAKASGLISELLPLVNEGIPIVGLEPGCLSALKDDYTFLAKEKEAAQKIARHSYFFEEFLVEFTTPEDFARFRPESPHQVLLHTHCHEKSLLGSEKVKAALQLPGNIVVEEVDSGCCGMAGSFGYEAEHYELSIQMGERRLFPAVRQKTPQTVVVAPGFSCRSQIYHGTQETAVHPAVFLRNIMNRVEESKGLKENSGSET